MSKSNTLTFPAQSRSPKTLVRDAESTEVNISCQDGDGSPDIDSGYGSAALNTLKADSLEISATNSTPNGANTTSSSDQRTGLGYPLVPSNNLKVFKREVSEGTWARYKDISERVKDPLLECTRKQSKKYRHMALRLAVLGTTEEDAKPRIVVLCHPKLQKKLRQFFCRPDIRSIYQPEDGILESLEVEIVSRPPEPKAGDSCVVVHFDHDIREIRKTLCGALIKLETESNTRLTTLGGLVKANNTDRTYTLYGMSAGHPVEELISFGHDDQCKGSSDEEMKDDSSEDEEGSSFDQSLALPNWSLVETGLHPSAVEPSKTRSHMWTRLGQTLPLSRTENAQYLDWALLAIDNGKKYFERNCLPLYADKQSVRSGDLILPTNLDDIPHSRSVVMMSGVQGPKKGILSLRVSYVLLGLGTDFVGAYLVTLKDNGAIVDGDSGSWIVDEQTHAVYGHLVASDMFGDGYVIPLQAAFDDMRMRLGVESIDLPSAVDIICKKSDEVNISLHRDVEPRGSIENERASTRSSRLLRMTEDERPFTRDFEDLFSTLMVSLPLTPHRVRFQKVDHTFTSEEAITTLGSLGISKSNRMPDPNDPSRIVTRTTTTTFSMTKETAKLVCQKFLEARFIESVDSKNDFTFKSSVWQLTPKGIYILQRFCNRNGINQRHVQLLLESSRNTMHLVILEREPEGDKIYLDLATTEVVFRRFVGQEGPNLKYSTANSDLDLLTDDQTGLVGVKMARECKVGDKTFWNIFTGKAAVDWLMECCTIVDSRETVELAGLFCEYGLISPIESTVSFGKFSSLRTSIYYVTEKGQRVAGWIPSSKTATNGTDPSLVARRTESGSRDSNTNKMTVIINDPTLRLLFREFLRDKHCEENLAFYLDVKEFLASYNTAKRLDTIRETLMDAYSLYNTFLAPGSPCELDIDYSLRTALAAWMTRAVGDDEATIACLNEVALFFDQAQNSVFKIMAGDLVPKFIQEPKYASILLERNLDIA